MEARGLVSRRSVLLSVWTQGRNDWEQLAKEDPSALHCEVRKSPGLAAV